MKRRIPTRYLAALLGVLYVALVATLPTTAADLSARQDLVGRWQGTLDARGTLLRIVFEVEASEDGTLSATLNSPDQGVEGIPVASVELDGASVRFDISALGTAFDGRLNEERRAIEGSWRQSGTVLPLTLDRDEPRPQR